MHTYMYRIKSIRMLENETILLNIISIFEITKYESMHLSSIHMRAIFRK
jgi:hypothetical protein